jgi:NTP pyrophosphatase (non-canonical NTP hydrolase)
VDLKELGKRSFDNAVSKGFHPDEIVQAEGGCRNLHYLATRIALIHSEASEALEELRNQPLNLDAFGEELADVVIRVADLAHIAGANLEAHVEAKMAKNVGREFQLGARARRRRRSGDASLQRAGDQGTGGRRPGCTR